MQRAAARRSPRRVAHTGGRDALVTRWRCRPSAPGQSPGHTPQFSTPAAQAPSPQKGSGSTHWAPLQKRGALGSTVNLRRSFLSSRRRGHETPSPQVGGAKGESTGGDASRPCAHGQSSADDPQFSRRERRRRRHKWARVARTARRNTRALRRTDHLAGTNHSSRLRELNDADRPAVEESPGRTARRRTCPSSSTSSTLKTIVSVAAGSRYHLKSKFSISAQLSTMPTGPIKSEPAPGIEPLTSATRRDPA